MPLLQIQVDHRRRHLECCGLAQLSIAAEPLSLGETPSIPRKESGFTTIQSSAKPEHSKVSLPTERSLSHLRLALLLCPLVLAGCGYMVGSPYSAEIRTIHVPMFTSDTNRRGLEYQLTEAVQKQIQMRTHFRIVKEHQADTRLTGKLTTSRKNVLGLTQNSDPRELQLNLQVEITWVDNRTGEILRQQPVDIPPELVQIASQSEFAPEVGHSLATAEREAIDRLARTIVDLMEMPWPS